ncbi:MAG TPA: tRNA lysidine(34) synthetase TilS [Gemmatimonadaceae bacterium]|nr:tRNA lysidine(34) synthetase TilS [Gemmatimonadaceae bacterium]
MSDAVAAVHGAVCSAVARADWIVLAVSGGRDSMVLLDAFATLRGSTVAGVATFDHATGEAATRAIALVRDAAAQYGLAFVTERAAAPMANEEEWRGARWRFLNAAALRLRARVATAHTRDDQIETVLMRALRDTGPRGLAGLYAESSVVRPFLGVSRSQITAYAQERAVPFIDDPSNESRRHLRNRVRLDILPACESVRPGFGNGLLDIARRSAEWRADVERTVDAMSPWMEGTSVFVPAEDVLGHPVEMRAILWPAIAARAGVVLDRRGTERLAAFTTRSSRTSRIQLAGGHEVVRHARTFEVRPAAAGRVTRP